MQAVKFFKPIYLLDERSYRPERQAVYDAISTIFVAAGLPAMPPVADYGRWCHPQYLDPRGYMVPFLSVPWYIEQAREVSRRRVNVQSVMDAFRREPWRREDVLGDHYDILLVDEPLFDPVEEEQFGLASTPGYAAVGVAAIISTHDIDRLDRVPYSLLKTLAIRELAHAFGVPGLRSEATEVIPRLACTNPCVLGRCVDMPEDLERLTDLRLSQPPFCDLCLEELRRNLSQDHEENLE